MNLDLQHSNCHNIPFSYSTPTVDRKTFPQINEVFHTSLYFRVFLYIMHILEMAARNKSYDWKKLVTRHKNTLLSAPVTYRPAKHLLRLMHPFHKYGISKNAHQGTRLSLYKLRTTKHTYTLRLRDQSIGSKIWKTWQQLLQTGVASNRPKEKNVCPFQATFTVQLLCCISSRCT